MLASQIKIHFRNERMLKCVSLFYTLVWFGFVSVHVKIASGLGHFYYNAFHFCRDNDLASQSRCFRQPKGHVQHIFFVFRWVWQSVVYGTRQYTMTCAASANCPPELDRNNKQETCHERPNIHHPFILANEHVNVHVHCPQQNA